MVKEENEDIFMPQMPPGFTPEPSKPGTGAAAEYSRNQNPTCSGHEQPPPETYVPRLGPQQPRRRGRPPKAPSMSQQFPLTMPQEQTMSCFKSSEACNQEVGEQVPAGPVSYCKNNTISRDVGPKNLQHVPNPLHETDMNLVHTLKAIKKKYGDITQGCSLESDRMKNLVLFGICKVVQDLQGIQLKDLDITTLDSCYAAMKDAENMNVNVQWLRSRLDAIKEAVASVNEAKELANEKNRHLQNISKKRKELLLLNVELDRLKSEIQDIEDEVAEEVLMVQELNENIGTKTSNLTQFQNKYLMDGLV